MPEYLITPSLLPHFYALSLELSGLLVVELCILRG